LSIAFSPAQYDQNKFESPSSTSGIRANGRELLAQHITLTGTVGSSYLRVFRVVPHGLLMHSREPLARVRVQHSHQHCTIHKSLPISTPSRSKVSRLRALLWYYLSFREEFVVLDLDHLTERSIVRCWEVNKASSTSGQALEEKAQ
jgi:hypothetical protein